MEPSWKIRGYAHFDRRPSLNHAQNYVTNPERVKVHAFWPFIQRIQCTPRFGRDPDTGKRGFLKMKARPIRYAAHMDSHIFGYYAYLITQALESRYQAPFGASVLAYRKFPVPKNNVHFARDAFAEIASRGACDAVALDIEGFFDHLDWNTLKLAWRQVFGWDRLPDDHYAVFKAITRYCWIDRDSIAAALDRDIPRRWRPEAERICSPSEFRTLIRPYLTQSTAGIPQGSPISAALANLYLLESDRLLYSALKDINVSYRRYSDDILLICPTAERKKAEIIVCDELERVKLSIQHSKTCRVAFREQAGQWQGWKITDGMVTAHPMPLQYLGLTWDGRAIRLRSQTLALFQSRMVRNVWGARKAASKSGDKAIRRQKLYRRFSHLGRKKDVFGPHPEGRPRNRNFIHYGRMAARLTGSEEIRRQVGREWGRLEREIGRAEARLIL